MSAQAGYPDIIQAVENTCAHLLFNRMPGSELNRYSWLLNNNLFRCASISINHVTSERTWGVLAKLSLLSSRCWKTVLKVSESFCLPVIDLAHNCHEFVPQLSPICPTVVTNLVSSCQQTVPKLSVTNSTSRSIVTSVVILEMICNVCDFALKRG